MGLQLKAIIAQAQGSIRPARRVRLPAIGLLLCVLLLVIRGLFVVPIVLAAACQRARSARRGR